MQDYPTLWFLRHGETEWNAERRIQGQLESQLTTRGVAHAHQQQQILTSVLRQNPACFVSPLGRAQQTAEIALGDYPYRTEARLAEAQAGLFQGMTLAEVNARYPEIYAANPHNLDLFCAAPNGEGYDRFLDRIQSFLAELVGPTVIVSHGLLGQVLRGLVCGLDRSGMAVLPNEQGCVYLLEHGAETVLRGRE